MTAAPSVHPVIDLASATGAVDALIVAGGFEERAFKVLEEARFHPDAHCVIIRYANNVLNNRTHFVRYLTEARKKLAEERIHVVTLRDTDIAGFSADFNKALANLPRDVRAMAVDISGMPAYLICTVLRILREHRSRERQTILYTSAQDYTPTRAEYDRIIADAHEEIELVPRSMVLEMGDNLVLDAFSGYRSQAGKTCLVIFAGYDPHRTAGVLDAVNPALLLLLYGKPGNPELAWRLDLSQRLHKKFERGRRTATEIVSTLEVSESLETLEEYYNYLIDDYDLVIAPISSKMDTLATYLFWERYGEVQLTFPIPIGYNPDNCPQGASTTYQMVLEPRRSLFRSQDVPATP
ncbi:hypothetical protein [Caulobacter segnis]|uniref:hypothetical protein n=1 Tax=Caulobacter segnis TaxID=88688 RepID=UPI002862E5EB|nr:hypothetical protein [Caulobacter segnis]MDR6626203.1 hypothetical protein [Caulobacter segnis]